MLAQLHHSEDVAGTWFGENLAYFDCLIENENRCGTLMNHDQDTDGFVIFEMDLKLRGERKDGEFFGTRQHGLPELKITNLYQDTWQRFS